MLSCFAKNRRLLSLLTDSGYSVRFRLSVRMSVCIYDFQRYITQNGLKFGKQAVDLIVAMTLNRKGQRSRSRD